MDDPQLVVQALPNPIGKRLTETLLGPTSSQVDQVVVGIGIVLRKWEFRHEVPLLEVFLERLTLPAYFDKDGKAIKLDKTFAVSATERDRIIDLVERGGKLAGLLTGPASAGRRAASRPAADATYGGRMTLEAIPLGVYYGHKMGLMISLTNTGGGALFDTAIFNGLPAHTQFVRFAVDAEAARGYFPYFSKRRKTIVVKLDRPIAPGESFRILVVLRADPWLLNTPATVGKES